jgi:hypothetical protein
VELVDDPYVKRTLFHERHAIYSHEATNSIDWTGIGNAGDARDRLSQEELNEASKTFEQFWRTGVTLGRCVIASKRLASLVELRARRFAHNFDLADPAVIAKPYTPPKYGHERRLLSTTIKVADALNGAIRNASFDYESSRKHCLRNSAELWNSCRFGIP